MEGAAGCGVPSDSATVNKLMLEALDEVEALMRAAFAAVKGSPEPGSALDQVYLLDGRSVVEDYLDHGEAGLAFDHLLYMIREPPLRISQDCMSRLRCVVDALGYPPDVLAPVEVEG